MDDRNAAAATAAGNSTGASRRVDIDALRAVAIVAVVLFHAHLLPGGFIGVDILFVVTGYLMAVIVGRMIDQDRFSLVAFYARRARRIVPALVAVLLAVSVVGSLILLPDDIRNFGRSVIATAGFTANLYFRAQATDYFSSESVVYQPLLHCWSLAVETQFYILFPLLIMAARRISGRAAFNRLVLIVLVVIALCSLLFSVYEVEADPQAAFYLLPSRMWQLLAGAIVYFVPVGLVDKLQSSWRAGLAAMGTLMLSVALATFSSQISFPGLNALLPVAGTCLIVLARPGTELCLPGLKPLLSSRVVVLPAQISYSLYLWHWPLFVFARYLLGPNLPLALTMLLIVLAVILSWFSWRWVERPFLRHLPSVGAYRQIATPLAMLLVLATAGFMVRDVVPKQNRLLLPKNVTVLAAAGRDYVSGDCKPTPAASKPPCKVGRLSEKPDVLLWGNSFARMWLPALDTVASENGRSAIAAIRSDCSPASHDGPQSEACRQFNLDTLWIALTDDSIRTIVLSANWASPEITAAGLAEIIPALREKGKAVFVVLKPPFPGYRVSHALAIAALRGTAPPALEPAARQIAERNRFLAMLRPLTVRYDVQVLDPTDRFCDANVCRVQDDDGTVLYYDAIHVTRSAALKYRSLFAPVFDR